MAQTKSGLNIEDFAGTVQGKQVALYVLTNKKGHEVTVCNYGGTIVSIMMPDRDGKLGNVVLGMPSLERLMNSSQPFLGVAVGRYGNRIAKGKFTLDGVEYNLAINNGENHLHGGPTGFHARVWNVKSVSEQEITLAYVSADGEEGYPGELSVEITYALTDNDEVKLTYKATTNKPTLCNLTNHSFFNLEGPVDGVMSSVENHTLTMNCNEYIPVSSAGAIPYGRKDSVVGTPFDFLTPHRIGDRIDDPFEQTQFGAGYDHSFCVNQAKPGEMTLGAIYECEKTGRVMKAYTTEPGMQCYTGNFLDDCIGQGGVKFPRRSGVCFEAQHHPDCINHPSFEQCVLRPGEVYSQETVYEFSVK